MSFLWRVLLTVCTVIGPADTPTSDPSYDTNRSPTSSTKTKPPVPNKDTSLVSAGAASVTPSTGNTSLLASNLTITTSAQQSFSLSDLVRPRYITRSVYKKLKEQITGMIVHMVDQKKAVEIQRRFFRECHPTPIERSTRPPKAKKLQISQESSSTVPADTPSTTTPRSSTPLNTPRHVEQNISHLSKDSSDSFQLRGDPSAVTPENSSCFEQMTDLIYEHPKDQQEELRTEESEDEKDSDSLSTFPETFTTAPPNFRLNTKCTSIYLWSGFCNVPVPDGTREAYALSPSERHERAAVARTGSGTFAFLQPMEPGPNQIHFNTAEGEEVHKTVYFAPRDRQGSEVTDIRLRGCRNGLEHFELFIELDENVGCLSLEAHGDSLVQWESDELMNSTLRVLMKTPPGPHVIVCRWNGNVSQTLILEGPGALSSHESPSIRVNGSGFLKCVESVRCRDVDGEITPIKELSDYYFELKNMQRGLSSIRGYDITGNLIHGQGFTFNGFGAFPRDLMAYRLYDSPPQSRDSVPKQLSLTIIHMLNLSSPTTLQTGSEESAAYVKQFLYDTMGIPTEIVKECRIGRLSADRYNVRLFLLLPESDVEELLKEILPDLNTFNRMMYRENFESYTLICEDSKVKWSLVLLALSKHADRDLKGMKILNGVGTTRENGLEVHIDTCYRIFKEEVDRALLVRSAHWKII